MGTSVGRRAGAIILIVVVLGLGLAPAASAAPEQAPTNAPSASCAPTYYRIRYGDNLTSIAWRYGVTVWQLQQWNGIPNPNRIYAGRTLVIYRCGYPAPHPPPSPCQPGCYQCTCPAPKPPPPPPPPCGCGVCPCPQPPHPPPPHDGCWNGEYFNNPGVEPPPSLTRCDANINFDWTGTSPAPGTIQQYDFSVRWSRVFYQDHGTYRVTATSDDGVRIWIDDVPIIDGWSVHPVTTYVQDVVLYSGNHTWTVEYAQAEGEAVIQVTSQKIN